MWSKRALIIGLVLVATLSAISMSTSGSTQKYTQHQKQVSTGTILPSKTKSQEIIYQGIAEAADTWWLQEAYKIQVAAWEDLLRAASFNEWLAEQFKPPVPRYSTPQYVSPSPVSSTDGSCAYEGLIRSTFPEDADYMVEVAKRESHCDPCAFYPGRSDCGAMPSTAKGMFQLLGHDAMIQDICGSVALWSDPYCNAKVARALYDSSGRSPWRL